MWKVPSTNLNKIFEPLEVRLLKQQLASISCKCGGCVQKRTKEIKDYNSKECQTSSSFIRLIPEPSEHTSINVKQHKEDLINRMWCPGCFMALHTKRNVFKDEETATEVKMISSDKSSGKFVWFSHQSTAVVDDLLEDNCNASVCDSVSESSYYDTILKQKYEIPFSLEQDPNTTPLQGCNLWLDSYINSIRPPLLGWDV